MLNSGLPDSIAEEEDLTRFLTQSGHYSRSKCVVKYSAFMPSASPVETSVYRTGRDPIEDLWRLGAAVAGTRSLHGAAVLKARAVYLAGLTAVPAEPPPRHAVVANWPVVLEDSVLEKAERMRVAKILAQAAGAPTFRT